MFGKAAFEGRDPLPTLQISRTCQLFRENFKNTANPRQRQESG